MSLLLLPVLVVVALAVILARRNVASRARVLKRSAFVLMALFTFVVTMFVAGEAFDDPGGWEAVGLVAGWVLPIVGLALLAWYRPEAGTIVLTMI
jgi:hypothetical protein